MESRVHITGASGSGTSTLGRALAGQLGLRHFDTDDFYWLPSDPPFRQSRPMPDRLDLLEKVLAQAGQSGWALSGSLCGWGDRLIPQFDLVAFLATDTALRLERLRSREVSRYGAEAVAPGGALHGAHLDFLAWAARYDDGPAEMRSRAMHEAWLAGLPCPVLRLDGSAGTMQQVQQVIAAMTRQAANGRGCFTCRAKIRDPLSGPFAGPRSLDCL